MVSQNVRIVFRKRGKMQFISHLDLCRTMRSALVRSRLPVKYTEGFNPHIKMTFALPLSIGAQSECEYMDLILTRECTEQEILSALKKQLPSDLAPYGAKAPVSTYAQIGYAEYRIKIEAGQCRKEQIAQQLSQPLWISKRTKQGGEKQVDIAPAIARFAIDEAQDGTLILTVLLQADNQNYLNPEYLAKALGLVEYEILRTAVYLADRETLFS